VANKTFSVEEAVGIIGAPSPRFLIERFRDRTFPARKVGRVWRLTEQDIIDILEILKNDAGFTSTAPTGLTSRSQKRATRVMSEKSSVAALRARE
jgi:hypothetical protein